MMSVSSSSRPATAPDDDVEAKYMLTARVRPNSKGPNMPQLRPLKMFPSPRAATAPDSSHNTSKTLSWSSRDPLQSARSLPEGPVVEFVESPTTFTVVTQKGPEKFPRNTWLALEPKLMSMSQELSTTSESPGYTR